jgi:TPR repeat protein
MGQRVSTSFGLMLGAAMSLLDPQEVRAQAQIAPGTASEIMTKLKSGDAEAGLRLAEASCERQESAGCGMVGMIYANPQFGLQNLALSRDAFEQACTGGFYEACGPLAQMQATGSGGEVDRPAAIRSLEHACEGNVPQACEAAENAKAELARMKPEPVPAPQIVTPPSSSSSSSRGVSETAVQSARRQIAGIERICSATFGNRMEAAKLMQDCAEAKKPLERVPYDMKDGVPPMDKAVASLVSAAAIAEHDSMFQRFVLSGIIPQDKMFIPCMGFDRVEYLLDESQSLSATPLAKDRDRVLVKLEMGRGFCD